MISFFIQDDDKYKSFLSPLSTDISINDLVLFPTYNKLMNMFSHPLSRKFFLEKINQNNEPKNILITKEKWNMLTQIANLLIQSINSIFKSYL